MTTFVYLEDDMLSRQVMEMILTRQLGYSDVTMLEDSTDFEMKIGALPYVPDVVFVDIHMRPHDGFEVLKRLRSNTSYSDSKIVALTASVMNEEVKLLRDAGFDGVIGKPVDRSVFPDLLERILQGEKVWRPT